MAPTAAPKFVMAPPKRGASAKPISREFLVRLGSGVGVVAGLDFVLGTWPLEVQAVHASGAVAKSTTFETQVKPGDVLLAIGQQQLDPVQGGGDAARMDADGFQKTFAAEQPVSLTFRRSLLNHLDWIRRKDKLQQIYPHAKDLYDRHKFKKALPLLEEVKTIASAPYKDAESCIAAIEEHEEALARGSKKALALEKALVLEKEKQLLSELNEAKDSSLALEKKLAANGVASAEDSQMRDAKEKQMSAELDQAKESSLALEKKLAANGVASAEDSEMRDAKEKQILAELDRAKESALALEKKLVANADDLQRRGAKDDSESEDEPAPAGFQIAALGRVDRATSVSSVYKADPVEELKLMLQKQDCEMRKQMQHLRAIANETNRVAEEAQKTAAEQVAADRQRLMARSQNALVAVFAQAEATDALSAAEVEQRVKLSLKREAMQKEQELRIAQLFEFSQTEERERQMQLALEHEAKMASMRAIAAEQLARQALFAKRAGHAEQLATFNAEEAMKDREQAYVMEAVRIKNAKIAAGEARVAKESSQAAEVARQAEAAVVAAAQKAAEEKIRLGTQRVQAALDQAGVADEQAGELLRMAEAKAQQAAEARAAAMEQAATQTSQMQVRDRSAQIAVEFPAPACLEVSAPNARSVEGMYDLVPGKAPNGFPLWKRRRGNYWFFSGVGGQWFIGDNVELSAGFQRDSGLVVSYYLHKGLMPDEFGSSEWRRFDGVDYVRDSTIQVKRRPPPADASRAKRSGVGEVDVTQSVESILENSDPVTAGEESPESYLAAAKRYDAPPPEAGGKSTQSAETAEPAKDAAGIESTKSQTLPAIFPS